MDLDLVCVSSYLVLLQERHYGRAAARLHMTSSALTKRVQRLEHQLGVTLLVRDTAGIVGPTPAGTRFASEAGLLLAQATAVRRATRQVARETRAVRCPRNNQRPFR